MNCKLPQKRLTPDTDVLIVGAGIAGLYTGFRLDKAGVSFQILEADDHAGGRISSRPERHSHLGLTLDEGANLINSTDTLAIRLLDRFAIPYVRRLKHGMDSMHYLVDGTEYDQNGFDQLLFSESREAINRFVHDQEHWQTDPDRDTNPDFIGESIASYLARCGAGPVLRSMLKSFFWSEYGYSLEDLNLHVLFDYLEVDLHCPCFKLIPNVDEAYTVPGGTGQITAQLEAVCHPNIRYGRRVVRIEEQGEIVVVAHVDPTGNQEITTARQIFFAAPLHSLKRMAVEVTGLSQAAIDEASRSSYARGTKLHLKFMEGFHDRYRYSGILLTDTGEQIWPSSLGQGGAGLLTVLTGPLPEGRAAAVEQTGHLLRALDQICPGLSELFVAMERSDAPMSYSGSLRPGESAHLDIHDGAEHWATVGEASSHELQGYLEGALRSAEAGVSRYLLRRRLAHKSRRRRSPHVSPEPVGSES